MTTLMQASKQPDGHWDRRRRSKHWNIGAPHFGDVPHNTLILLDVHTAI